jgi:hypothetical protein
MAIPSKGLEKVIREMGQNYSDALDWLLIHGENGIDGEQIDVLVKSYYKTRNRFHKAIIVIMVEMNHLEWMFDRLTVDAYDKIDRLCEKLGI